VIEALKVTLALGALALLIAAEPLVWHFIERWETARRGETVSRGWRLGAEVAGIGAGSVVLWIIIHALFEAGLWVVIVGLTLFALVGPLLLLKWIAKQPSRSTGSGNRPPGDRRRSAAPTVRG
jgi:hypothetical protein